MKKSTTIYSYITLTIYNYSLSCLKQLKNSLVGDVLDLDVMRNHLPQYLQPNPSMYHNRASP